MRRLVLLTLLLFPISEPLKARDLISNCEYFFDLGRRLLGTTTVAPIPATELGFWQKTFGDDGRFLIDLANSRSAFGQNEPLLFWWMYTKLPETIQTYLNNLPEKGARLDLHLLSIVDAIGFKGPKSDSFLTQMGDHWFEYGKWSSIDGRTLLRFRDWLAAGAAKLRAEQEKNPNLLAELTRQWENGLLHVRVKNFWSRYGEQPLPLTAKGGGYFEIKIGTQIFNAVSDGNALRILKVPRELVKHPAWNPISLEHLHDISDGGTATPSFYPAVVGLDGNFYLEDRNHRFELDHSKTVSVLIGTPPSSVDFSGFLDLIGAPEPSKEKIQAFYLGKAQLTDLASPQVLSQIKLPIK
jgi:hypothetical protein